MKVKDQSELKILQSQYSTLKKQFMDSIADYQKVEKQYRTKYKERMERQYRIGKLLCIKLMEILNFVFSQTRCY